MHYATYRMEPGSPTFIKLSVVGQIPWALEFGLVHAKNDDLQDRDDAVRGGVLCMRFCQAVAAGSSITVLTMYGG